MRTLIVRLLIVSNTCRDEPFGEEEVEQISFDSEKYKVLPMQEWMIEMLCCDVL